MGEYRWEVWVRGVTLAAIATALLTMQSMPMVQAQTEEDTLLRVVEQFVATLPEDAQFEIVDTGAADSWDDLTGDFEHPSGEVPGFTPEFIDIASVAAVRLGPGWETLFGSTDDVAGPWSLGQRLVEGGSGVVQTYSSDATIRDGSQYRTGAYLFGIGLAGAPPASVPGRCEFVVWLHSTRNTAEWDNPLPLDPAVGTNVAFGVGLNPEGESGTFALELPEQGGVFETSFEFDVRAFVSGDFVGVFVPTFAVAEFDAMNVSSFCAAEGFAFEAEVSGADQLGLVELTAEGLAEYAVEVAPTSTITLPPPNTLGTALGVDTTSTLSPDGAGVPAWGLSLIGAAALAALLLAYVRRNRSDR